MRTRKWYSKKKGTKQKETAIHTCKLKEEKNKEIAQEDKRKKIKASITNNEKKPKILYRFCRSLFPA